MSEPTPRLGAPRSLRAASTGRTGAPTPVADANLGTPIRVGGWQSVGHPIQLPGSGSGGGTRPIFEGFGPPPAEGIEGSLIDDYYLDKITGDLYRLGG